MYAMLHQIFNDFILSAMCLPQRCHTSVTIETTELSDDILMSSRCRHFDINVMP